MTPNLTRIINSLSDELKKAYENKEIQGYRISNPSEGEYLISILPLKAAKSINVNIDTTTT
jgi:hypothetical protein